MIKNILWDFDGVILDSMPIRDYGFRMIFKSYDAKLVEDFIEYHNLNGGLSRFHKIKYFYNNFLKKDISEDKINLYANEFSQIMKKELVNSKYLIEDTLFFLKNNYTKYNFHIVSGSEHRELNFLCEKLGLLDFFISINGSPTPKNELVKKLLIKNQYKNNETILIGDSLNDFEAAKSNNIEFFGFNNIDLKNKSKYINKFKEFQAI